MKNLNTSSISALVAGGCIALLPLDNLIDQFIAVVIAFITLSATNHFIKGIQK
jgi:hypothetical protein